MPTLREHFVTAVLTACFAGIAWFVWDALPGYLPRSFASEFRHLISVLAVFMVLSLLQVIVDAARSRLFAEAKHTGSPET
ncbi:MAG: hypothetical protein AAFX39_00555 [Pseudomonadota bacterium]